VPVVCRCGELSAGVEGGCPFCDIVVHFRCMTKEELRLTHRHEFMCHQCSDFRRENNALFDFWREKLDELKKEKEALGKIVHVMKKQFYRRKYLHLKTAAVVLQNCVRRFLFWR
jgi:hypothetical protein